MKKLFIFIIFLFNFSQVNAAHNMQGIHIAQLSQAAANTILKGKSENGSLGWSKYYLLSVKAGNRGYIALYYNPIHHPNSNKVACYHWLVNESEDYLQYGKYQSFSKVKLCKDFQVRKIKDDKLEIVKNGEKTYAKVSEVYAINKVEWEKYDLDKFAVEPLKLGPDTEISSLYSRYDRTEQSHNDFRCEACKSPLKQRTVARSKLKFGFTHANAIVLTGPAIAGGYKGNAASYIMTSGRYDKNSMPKLEQAKSDLIAQYGEPSVITTHNGRQETKYNLPTRLLWVFDRNGQQLKQNAVTTCDAFNTESLGSLDRFGYGMSTLPSAGNCGLILSIQFKVNRLAGGDLVLAQSYRTTLQHGYSMLLNYIVNQMSFVYDLREFYLEKSGGIK